MNYTVGGGSHDDNFTYSGTLTFGSGGTLLSSILTITEGGDDRGRPILTSFIQQGLFYAVPVRLADGTLLIPPPPVPEPASWTMMIAGLGAVGLALRRRQPALRAA
ncbi:PEPxxWA-CTERM sorting domain-containing protein [uncultured Sphingomonas sp.]|uniref:PEPxxWA-CTERM sorting domain-containing protein n=1 Tax=uncultured Sphingomonas sp. TaxID=158754 RepID=UPI0035CA9A16